MNQRSSIKCLVNEFRINQFGNHSPIDKVVFTGRIGNQRMGDTLPFDFLPSTNK